MRNSSQKNFNLLVIIIYAKIMIVFALGLDILKLQDNAIIKLTKYSLEGLFCYRNISFNYFFLQNCKNLAY